MVKIVAKLTLLTTVSIIITIGCLIILIMSYLSPSNIIIEILLYFMFSLDIFIKLLLIVLSFRSFHELYEKLCFCTSTACDHCISYMIFGQQYENEIKRASAVSAKLSFTFSDTKEKRKNILNVKKLQRKLNKLNVSQIRKNLIINEEMKQTEISIQSERQIQIQNNKSLMLKNNTPEPSCKSPYTTPTISNAMAMANYNNGLHVSPSLCALNSKLSASYSLHHLSLDDGVVSDFEEEDNENDQLDKDEIEEKSLVFNV